MPSTQKEPLYELLHHPHIWRGCEKQQTIKTIPTGHQLLDDCLPGGGWPADSLSEVLLEQRGRGELRLVLPTLVGLSQQDDERCMVWVAPPWVPYAPALSAAGVDLARLLIVRADTREEVLWATEQSLRSGSCAAVLAWSAEADMASLRRLQLAASEGGTLGLLFRPAMASANPSAAALRLSLVQTADGLTVRVLKSRGAKPATVKLSTGAGRTRELAARLKRDT